MARSSGMFDQDVVDEMRRVFDRADKDGNGEVNAEEACKLFAQHCAPTDSPEQIRRTASGLRQQLDADRSGTISFDEYCFRFGRRLQMNRNRDRRSGTGQSGAPTGQGSAPSPPDGDAGAALRSERERLDREREALQREREDLRRQQQSDPASESLAVGSRVTLAGLRTAELNGRRGQVVSFDAATSRYVVLVDGSQKSLKLENLRLVPSQASSSGHQAPGHTTAPSQATGPSITTQLQQGLRSFAARVQVFLCEYEWWQIALAVVIFAIFVGAYFEVTAKYKRPPGTAMHGAMHGSAWDASEPVRDEQPYRRTFSASYQSEGFRDERRHDDFDDMHNDMHDDMHDDMHHRHSGQYHRQQHHRQGGYAQQGGYGASAMSVGGSPWTYVCLAVLGYLCWTGVIPVHRMSWFQIYMLWSIIEPLVMGGGRRGGGRGFGGGYGGFGRRRGMFG